MIQKEHEHIKNAKHDLQIVVIAENIRTPENVGMIMRLSEAFGVEKIYFAGNEITELTTKVKRASRNTYRSMNYKFVVDGLNEIHKLKNAGFRSIALEITENSHNLQNFTADAHDRIVLVVGSERQGVSDKLLQMCEMHYHIPMFGINSSINVVNALAIGLFKLTESSQ
jgi:tRNA G18 (ribose-2'-O)-methylase SpoU